MFNVHRPPASRAGPDWGRGRSGVVTQTREGLALIPGPTQLPTADLALRPLHRAGLVAGPRKGGVLYARLRERFHFTPQGFRGMASPTDGEPISAA